MIIETEGDIGDAVITLGLIRQLAGGPHTYVIQHSGHTKFKTPKQADKLCEMIKPLAEAQSYIKECRRIVTGEKIDWHNGTFRSEGYTIGRSLFDAHYMGLVRDTKYNLGMSVDDPWLDVEPDPRSKDRIIISRSGRYRNPSFPWMEVCKKYGDRLLFIGVDHEWKDFSGEFAPVEFVKTENMLDVAKLIKGSLLFIGNQSAPNAACEGLKHNSIQETSLTAPDCIYARSNAQHVYDGRVKLPGFGEEDTVVDKRRVDGTNVSKNQTPPNGWSYDGIPSCLSFQQCISMMAQLTEFRGVPEADIEKALLEFTVSKHPDYYIDSSAFFRVMVSMENAKKRSKQAYPASH